MANIRPYEAPGLGLQPSETGVESIANAARRMGVYGNQIAATFQQEGHEAAGAIEAGGQVADNYLTHRDISAGAANGAQFIAKMNDAWNQTAKGADPNDVTVKQKFMAEQLEPALEQFKSGFSTDRSQQWAEHFADQYRQHMENKTDADMSTLAGIAVRTNTAKTINALSAAVNSDPSSLDFALSSVDHSIGQTVASSPNLSAAQAAEVSSEVGLKAKEAIVKSAVSGMITQNPNINLDSIQKKYGDYINGAEMKMFQKAAQVQARSDAATARADLINKKTLADMQVHQGVTKILTDNLSFDTNGQPVLNPKFFQQSLDLAKQNPNAPSAGATVRTMLDWGEAQQNKEAKVTDPAVASAIDSRMFASDNPVSKLEIMRAEADKKISRPDAELRMKIIDQRDKLPTDPQFKFAMDGAKELIEGRTPGEKSMQAGKYAAFMQEFLQEYQRQKAAGTLPADALSLRNPDSLISKMMESYKSPLSAAIAGNGGITPPPPPSAPAPAAPVKVPEVGEIRAGANGLFKFKGGDWRDKKNWEPVS